MSKTKTAENTITFTCTQEFRDKDLIYIFITALEGGIGYWSSCSKYHWQGKDEGYDLKGFYAQIQIEEGEGVEGEPDEHLINARTILDGLQAYCRLHKKLFPLDNYDSGIADEVVQLGLFGEVVYG